MTDKWLHCNLCLARPSEKQKLFLITHCGHIFCSKCEKKATEPVCTICHKKCNHNWIDEKLNPEILNYFKPYEVLENKAIENLKKAREIRKFQIKQMNMLRIGEKKKAEKTEKMFKCAIQTMEKLKKDNRKWKDFVMQSQLDAPVMNMNRSSPGQSPHAVPVGSPTYAVPTKKMRSPSPLISYTVPNTPRGALPISMSRKHSAIPSEFQRGKRVSLISPPVDGKIVSPREAAANARQRTEPKGIAGQMAGNFNRRPFSMMNVNESPIPQVSGAFQGQSLNSPHTPSTPHSEKLRRMQMQQQQQQQWQYHQQGRQSTPKYIKNVQPPSSPFAGFPSLR